MSEAKDRWLEILRKNRLEAEEICNKDEQLMMRKKEIFEEAKENPEKKSRIFLLHRDIEADGTCTWPPSYTAAHGELEEILSFGKELKERQ